jgi:hypothetical protein
MFKFTVGALSLICLLLAGIIANTGFDRINQRPPSANAAPALTAKAKLSEQEYFALYPEHWLEAGRRIIWEEHWADSNREAREILNCAVLVGFYTHLIDNSTRDTVKPASPREFGERVARCRNF